MELPATVDISVTDRAGIPLPDLILGMRISSGTKNSYHVYFPKTDSEGHSSLSADDIAGQFKDHWEEGLMDYNGTLETAAQEVQLFLLDVTNIRSNQSAFMAWPLLIHEKTVWASRQEMLDYFLSSVNERYSMKELPAVIPSDGKLQAQAFLK